MLMRPEVFNKWTKQSGDTITAKVIADSGAPNGCRVTTMEWTYPRFIHAEIMTHRKLSRNSASSRAIPLTKMIGRVIDNPVFPIHWGKNEKGMQATEELGDFQKLEAATEWMRARKYAIEQAQEFEELGIHKQLANRLLEPWMWITVVVSATNFENLFGLRCHKDAEPHFQNLAYKVREAYDASKPAMLRWGEWHLPYFGLHPDDHKDIAPKDRPKVSAARCGRVSYLTHDGIRDPQEDLKLYDKLAAGSPLHASPLEHPAQAQDPVELRARVENPDWGNFDPGWLQYRKMHKGECITTRA